MNYNKTLEVIHNLNRFGIKPGLERITALLNELGNPQDHLQCVHIAGTNGKGSVSTMLSNVFKCQGKKTGLFISPYVVEFRERIQINSEYIPEEKLSKLAKIVLKASEKANKITGDPVTEFEFITALAFLYFKEEKCDIVVLETGLGGRLDSTNVIANPLLSVITKISLDHTAILGETISQIAEEKCGIIKHNSKVVTSTNQEEEALRVMKNNALQKNAKLIMSNLDEVSDVFYTPFGSTYKYKGEEITLSLAGKHQIENSLTVVVAAQALGAKMESIKKGILETTFPARLEVLSKKPLVLLDGAHNPNGAEALAAYLDEHNLHPIVLMGMMADKNCEEVLKYIATRAVSVATVTVKGNDRTETAEGLAKKASKYCKDVNAYDSYKSALNAVLPKKSKENVPLVICGSLYLASDIRNLAISMLKN